MTRVEDGDRDAPIEWRTYTPDGRVLTVRRNATSWTASCEGDEFEDERLANAIRDAVGHGRGATLQLHAHGSESLDRWVDEQARRIEAEAP